MTDKELKTILKDMDSYDYGELFDLVSDLVKEILILRAEVERLRAALERVSKIYPTPYVRQICIDALGLQP